MGKTSSWHSVKSHVYHNNPACRVGAHVQFENKCYGDGGRRLCETCSELNRKKREHLPVKRRRRDSP